MSDKKTELKKETVVTDARAGYLQKMSGVTLYLLRHGQTAHSRDNLFCGSGTDAPLTSDGIEMARAFAEAYRNHKFSAVFCSPQSRARETARPLCELRGEKPEIKDGLREIGYGVWEGKTVEEVQQEYGDDYQRWLANPVTNAPTNGGETTQAIATRALGVVEEIRSRFSSGDVLLVSHKATIRIVLASLLGLPLSQYRFRLACPVCSLSTIELTSSGPLLRTLGDRNHLSAKLRSLAGT